MSYKLKAKGYEYRGVKLGQNCVYNGKETIVIGFSEHFKDVFIVIENNWSNVALKDHDNISIILDGYQNSTSYYWVKLDNIKLSSAEQQTPIQPISLLHIADVLEDTINENETIDVEKIQLCIDSLRGIL